MKEAPDCICGCGFYEHAMTGVCVQGRVECDCMQYTPKQRTGSGLAELLFAALGFVFGLLAGLLH